ncbi:MAG TPA: discoidin domain-containing protein [Nitrososphaeraceae archaeon]|nr:discoidin domain-containing protein [Nitrososphaeraceae archaeon]
MVKIALSLVGLATSLIILQFYNNFAFSQTGNETGLVLNSSNLTTPSSPTSNDTLGGEQPPSGFVANGKINTLITVPNGKWLATGNWSITLNNGNVTSFEAKMTWYNSSGTNAHTHELTNFTSAAGDTQLLPMSGSSKQISIEGFTDVGTNNRVSWFEVPTAITINDRKIVSISVDDNKTTHHFGGQPLLGIVDSFVPCSDLPGPNMELLPPCSESTVAEESFGLTNDTSAFAPSEELSTYQGTSPGGIPPGGIPPRDEQTDGVILPGDEQSGGGGIPPRDEQTDEGVILPGDEQSGGGGIPPGDEQPAGRVISPGDEQSGGGGIPPGDEQPAVRVISPGDEQPAVGEVNPECTDLNIENITANGFESDPSDFHPPSDAIDGTSSTWWSFNGKDPWVEIHLSEPQSICGLSVEWNKGDERNYSFEIEVSEDGNNYQKVFEGNNKKGSSGQEIYQFEEQINGRYTKLTITSTSSKDGWASIQEISALGFPSSYDQTAGGGMPPGDNQTS